MPPKRKIPAPIDRPLSKAYLRQFVGWSTAYPPGLSEPNSVRVMENMWVDRNGALAVRPGLKYLSYADPPDVDPDVDEVPGTAFDLPLVGGQEPFYTNEGEKALLFGVRELDNTVGFRAMLTTGESYVVHELTDPEVGFNIPQGMATLAFSEDTTHIEYLQIDNNVVAMSDAGEPIRLFSVGGAKTAKKMLSISVPEWADPHKLGTVHPNGPWIQDQAYSLRHNVVRNPSFEIGTAYWRVSGGRGKIESIPMATLGGARALKITSLPNRTNMVKAPLHDVAGAGIGGWHPNKKWGNPKLTAGTAYMKVYDNKGKGLFLAYCAKITNNVKPGKRYRVAFDYKIGAHIEPRSYVTFYSASGAKIGDSVKLTLPESDGRYKSKPIKAPAGTVTMRMSVGGKNKSSTATYIKFKDVVFCEADESTAIFSGDDGADYYWLGTANKSASVHHPDDEIYVTHIDGETNPGAPLVGSLYAYANEARPFTMRVEGHDKDGGLLDNESVSGSTGTSWVRHSVINASTHAQAVRADIHWQVSLGRGDVCYMDHVLLEPDTAVMGSYFDGSTASTTDTTSYWTDRYNPHGCHSEQRKMIDIFAVPDPATPTADTLVATGGAAANPYKLGFFYTFSNEVGESAASKVTEQRTSRPWSNWRWETANAAGEPSGTPTDAADLCADQLAVVIPEGVFNRAIAEGAVRWNLYVFSWNDQEPVPVVASLFKQQELYADDAQTPLPYNEAGWLSVTPSRKIGFVEMPLPTPDSLANYSDPPQARNGVVAGDRLILVGDPRGLATIRWSSNQLGEYTNFTANAGGGEKTLTTGNLNIPSAVRLWQNPQSVDTITILCRGEDGHSTSYYMAPGTLQGGSGITGVMGFEETTNTPGTMSPYAAEVLNNALYRPTYTSFMKSTASNYNINHKTLSDKIINMWEGLKSKSWMMSAQLENRIYLLVHNPHGELLEDGCKGNEVWVYDVGSEEGIWSRFLTQGSSMRAVDVGDRTYMALTHPSGLYYFDVNARVDDYVEEDLSVLTRPIEWAFETNTQGANRAHDAWAHLQQVGVTLGNFTGTMQFGIRGWDLHGQPIEMVKQVTDDRPVEENDYGWEIEDPLLIRRDMKEWVLFGSSVPDKESSGHLGYAQYRYTPVSVNVGYEFGSVETFEYGSNVESGPNSYSENGVPVPYLDYTRP